jgi:hypothetical protein
MDSYDYPYIDALSELVEQLRHEGECYIEGKEYVENQLDLFDEEHNEEVKVAATTVKKSAKKIKDLMTGHGAEVEIIEHTDVSQEF